MAFDHSRHEMHRHHQVHHEAEDKPIEALTYTTIPIAGPAINIEAIVFDVNNHGVVVGEYVEFPPTARQHAFIYDRGIVTTIDPPDSRDAVAKGINDSGEVVGFYVNSNFDSLGFT